LAKPPPPPLCILVKMSRTPPPPPQECHVLFEWPLSQLSHNINVTISSLFKEVPKLPTYFISGILFQKRPNDYPAIFSRKFSIYYLINFLNPCQTNNTGVKKKSFFF
jgi:hypothetical protein